MTWFAFALFLIRRTEFAFNIGHFLIILPFHSIGRFSSSYFFNIWSFLKSLFWMKQIQGSVGVKIKEYVHALSEFLFDSLLLLLIFLLIFNLSPQINHFYYFMSLHDLQDVENHCAHLRDIELKSGRKNPYLRFPHLLFSI